MVQGLGVDYDSISCSTTSPEKPVNPSAPSPSTPGQLCCFPSQDNWADRHITTHSDASIEKPRERLTLNGYRKGKDKAGHSHNKRVPRELRRSSWCFVPQHVSISSLRYHQLPLRPAKQSTAGMWRSPVSWEASFPPLLPPPRDFK